MSAIRPGDLVMVVKPKPCCGNGALGFVFVVERIGRFPGACDDCGHRSTALAAAFGEDEAVYVFRLKRIDPLPAEDEVERVEEQTA